MTQAAQNRPSIAVTSTNLREAHRVIEQLDPRGIIYRAALELVNRAIRQRGTSLTLAEAVAVLLQTWNRSYYRFHDFSELHLKSIDAVLSQNYAELMNFRRRSIRGLRQSDELRVAKLYAAVEAVLGAVGAAKCLHLIAPRFFPLWDRAIAAGYGCRLKKAGQNAEHYWKFMRITADQCASLPIGRQDGVLKALDELNYCTFTIPRGRRSDRVRWELGPSKHH